MKKILQLIIIFSSGLLLQNCNDDDFDTRTIPNQQTEADILKDEEFRAENFGAPTTGDFIGLIKDIDGNKLINAQITIGNSVAITDRNGMFILNNADVFENFAYVKAQKEGYINGSRVVIPKETGKNRIDIILFKKDVTETITSGNFSIVSLDNGAKVNFSGGFVRQDGSEYNGQVDVVLNYIEPNSVNTFTQMPGGLLAQTESNDARNLETYGMLSVNLFSPSGERLNINEFNRATIEFPVHYSQSGIAPDFIPLWYFDETQGYWKEEGQAVKIGDMYTAEVSHFTWWNSDIPFDTIELCYNLMPSNTSQSTPYFIIFKRLINDQYLYSGTVYSDELDCIFIPINEEVSISIYQLAGDCFGQLIDTQTLGGYATDTSTNISFNESLNLLTTNITGFANNCDGNPITNGYIYVDEYNTFSITNGVINIGLQHCELLSTTIQLFDFDTSQWAILDNVPLNSSNYNIGTLSTCQDSGGIYNGDVTLLTQADVANFGALSFTTIAGDLNIGQGAIYSNQTYTLTDITDLSPLATVTTVEGSLRITGNENLQSIQDLNNITYVGEIVTVIRNDALTSLTGFNTSIVIEGSQLIISGNPTITSLAGLEFLTSINNLNIIANDGLTSLQGIQNITTILSLIIRNNNALSSLNELSNVSSLNHLYIFDNDALTTLTGLEQITEIVYLYIINNDALLNLNGLENLQTILTPGTGGIASIAIGKTQDDSPNTFINGPNPNLVDFCALQNLYVNGNGNTGSILTIIDNNGYNPSVQDIIDGNCSQ
ncbi:hypothetical protein IMCC3317_10520 [Kordia antarctica]|uniref:Internalin-A n=1 Tax=Kordia antarctica TaxID=1218801 RepID=A0A7L4ZGE3_9FLAO|nr:hypothetical protein [Kordia antarctica]QHI35705.1 hypothetical protein IMCC3317_10520 [Kordia antarctica]